MRDVIWARLERAREGSFEVRWKQLTKTKFVEISPFFTVFAFLRSDGRAEIVFSVCETWFEHVWKGPELVVLSFGEHSSPKQNLVKFHCFSQFLLSCASMFEEKFPSAYAVILARLERALVNSFEFLCTQFTKTKIGEISPFFKVFAFFRSNSEIVFSVCGTWCEHVWKGSE